MAGATRRRIGRILLSRGLVNIRHLAHGVEVQRAAQAGECEPADLGCQPLSLPGRGEGEGAGLSAERRPSPHPALSPEGREGACATPPEDRPRPRLGGILLHLGYVQPMHLVRALCDQAEMVNFLVVPPSAGYIVEPPLARLIPRALAHRMGILPLVQLPGAHYVVASADRPTGLTLARLRRRLRGPVEPVLVREPDFHRAIEACYDELDRRGTTPVRLGEILVRDRVVPAREIEAALVEARRTDRPLGEVLVRRRVVDEGLVYRMLARQRGLRLVSARAVVDPREAASLVGQLPRPYLRHNQVIPYRRAGRTVLAVTSNPNLDTLPLAEALGAKAVVCQLACAGEVAELLDEACRLGGRVVLGRRAAG